MNRQSSIENRQFFFALVVSALGPNPSLKSGEADAVPGGLAQALWTRLEFSSEQAENERALFGALLEDYAASLDGDGLAVAGERLPVSRDSQIPDSEFKAAAEEQAGMRQSQIENRQSHREPATANPQPSVNDRQSHRQPTTANRQPSPDLTDLSATLVMLFRADDEDARIEADRMRLRTQVWIYLMPLGRGVPREEIVLLRPAPLSDCGLVARAMKFYNSRSELKQAECQRLLRKADRIAAEGKRWEEVIESGDIGRLGPERANDNW